MNLFPLPILPKTGLWPLVPDTVDPAAEIKRCENCRFRRWLSRLHMIDLHQHTCLSNFFDSFLYKECKRWSCISFVLNIGLCWCYFLVYLPLFNFLGTHSPQAPQTLTISTIPHQVYTHVLQEPSFHSTSGLCSDLILSSTWKQRGMLSVGTEKILTYPARHLSLQCH